MTWWDNDWDYRLKIKVNSDHVDTTISGVPLWVRLRDENFDFSQVATVSGVEIRFVDSDNTQIPHEIENWNTASGIADIWVKFSEVSSAEDSYVWMYYGNSTASGVADIEYTNSLEEDEFNIEPTASGMDDDFTGINNDPPASGTWSFKSAYSPENMYIWNNQLRVTNANDEREIVNIGGSLYGDFIVDVDFNIVTDPGVIEGWGAGIYARTPNRPGQYVIADKGISAGAKRYRMYANAGDRSAENSTVASGTLRLKRVGNVFTMYHKDSSTGGSFDQVGASTWTDNNFGPYTLISLWTDHWNSNPTAVVDFDNFTVSGTVYGGEDWADARWTWQGQTYGAHREHDGFHTIDMGSGNPDLNPNWIYQTAGAGEDFDAITKMTLAEGFDINFQQAGLQVLVDADNWAKICRVYNGGVGGQVIETFHEDTATGWSASTANSDTTVYFRIIRINGIVNTYYSTTGDPDWTLYNPAGQLNDNSAIKVGLFANDPNSNYFIAKFDWFRMRTRPYGTQVWSDYDLVYHLNEDTLDGTAGQVFDSSPVGNHGTSSGHPTPGEVGIVSKSILNEGSDFIQSEGIAGVTGSDDRTTMLWFKPTVADQGTWAGMFSYGTSSVNTSWYMESATNNEDYYSFLLYGTSGDTPTWIAVDPAEDWNHWALSWDGTDWKGFYNGNLISNRSASPNTATSVYYIGKNRDNNISCKGYLDEVRVATKAISDEEIKVQYLNIAEHDKVMTYLPAVVSGTVADKYGNPISGVPVKIISYDKDTLEIMDYTTVSTNGYEIGATTSGTEVLVALSFEGSFGGDTNIAGAEFRTPIIWGG